jgi:glycosyltransferase involved in cell wall biosynthesis
LLFAATELARRGHDVEICSLHAPDDLLGDFQGAGLRVHRLQLASPLDWPRTVAALTRVINDGAFDIVRSLMAEASMTAALTRPLARRPLRVASYHSVEFDMYPANNLQRRARRAVYKALMRSAVDGHVGISTAVARHHERHLGLPHVDVIWNGFPVAELQRQADAAKADVRARLGLGDAFVVVCPARLASDKGHEYLIEAVSKLGDRAPVVLLYGTGPREGELRSLAARLGVGALVRFMGTVPQADLMPVVAAADALVLPSPQGEGFGRVLAEAMAVGTPVVTPGIAGALDFVEHERNGLFVAPRSAEAIAGALRRLAETPGLGPRLGRAARTRIETDFDIRICGDRWEGLFERLAFERGWR